MTQNHCPPSRETRTLLAAKVDDRVRADILGHKYDRSSYGDGGHLVGRREALALIALYRVMLATITGLAQEPENRTTLARILS